MVDREVAPEVVHQDAAPEAVDQDAARLAEGEAEGEVQGDRRQMSTVVPAIFIRCVYHCNHVSLNLLYDRCIRNCIIQLLRA